MGIRLSSKAFIIHEGKVLFGYGDWYHGTAYDLPGGGQHTYETMEEALRREVLEETGYSVKIVRLIAIKEEIFTLQEVREKWPDFAHRLNHVFLCELEDVPRKAPTEIDWANEGHRWIPLEDLSAIKDRVFPRGLIDALPRIFAGETVVLDTHYLNDKLDGM